VLMRIRRQHNKGSGGVEKAGEGAVSGGQPCAASRIDLWLACQRRLLRNEPLPAETRFCSGLCAADCNTVVAAQTALTGLGNRCSIP
jgi:hypothetical protein